MQADNSLGGRYRPPALRALASGGSPPNDFQPSVTTTGDGSTLPPTNYPPGFRRARAGTLPSNVQLAAQRFAASATDPSSLDHLPRPTPIAPIPSLAAPSRPGLRHATTTIAPPVAQSNIPERNSRLRSGSLTLPAGGISNAFGSSIFTSSWLPSTTGTGPGFSTVDELRSDPGGDEFNVHTLDYLGLDDGQTHRAAPPPPPAATLSELRNQAQAAIAGNLITKPLRNRATTISNPYRNGLSVPGSLLSTPAAEEEDEYFYNDDMGYDRQQLGAYDIGNSQQDYSQSSYLAKGYKTTDHLTANRPRAISVGILDDPMRSLQQRRTTVSEAYNSYQNELVNANNLALANNNFGNPGGILKSDSRTSARAGVSPSVHFPNNGVGGNGNGDLPIGRGASAYLLAPSSHNRSVSPKSEGPNSQIQTPTRSLWIGNLDSAVTSEQLIHVFAPYGAIESLRLLPEKVSLHGLPCILMPCSSHVHGCSSWDYFS
jgi:protein JSN1